VSIWSSRAREERVLLNPGFCATLLWHAAYGHHTATGTLIRVEECFLVLPLVLERGTRESLPRDVRTSLVTWLDSYPLVRSQLAVRAQSLVEFTREALLFGTLHGLLRVEVASVHARSARRQAVTASLRNTTDEVRFCAKKAEFVGRWFGRTGSAATIFALFGVKP
jgi:hypothetical protein